MFKLDETLKQHGLPEKRTVYLFTFYYSEVRPCSNLMRLITIMYGYYINGNVLFMMELREKLWDHLWRSIILLECW